MFGRRKQLDDPNLILMNELSDACFNSRRNLVNIAQGVYLLSQTVNLYIGPDKESEEEKLQKEKEHLRNAIALYDADRSVYLKKKNELNYSWVIPPNSHAVIAIAIKNLLAGEH